jgi:competence ComEA-like helix-hairpin-helix protein
MPKQFDVRSLVFVTFGMNSRQFDVKLKGKFAGSDDDETIVLEDNGEDDDLDAIRYILTKLAGAYGNNTPVAFSLTFDDNGKIIVPSATPTPCVDGELINVNTACKAKLKTLPGIGPATADAIVAKRPFKSIDEIENVDGIGPAKMHDISPLITV